MLLRIALVTLALAGLAFASEQAVTITNRHRFISSQASVRYGVRVPKHAANRVLIFSAVDAEDGNVVRSSREDLAGDRAPLYREFEWRLGAANLILVAALYDVRGFKAKAEQPVCIYDLLRPCGEAGEP
jgi:hypothetical protein